MKEAATSAVKAESEQEAKDNLLVLSKFLRAAAAKRQGGDETSPENRAFEGALLLVYGGEAGAVAAMESLIAGRDEKVPTVDQIPSEYTCKIYQIAFINSEVLIQPQQTNKSVTSLSNMPLMPPKKLGLKTSPNPNLPHRLLRNRQLVQIRQLPMLG